MIEPTPETLLSLYRQGIRQFNERFFFECHESLEAVWMAEPRREIRRFFQGIIQIAVGFHHLSNENIAGARSLLRKGSEKLDAFRPFFYGVDVDALLERVAVCRTEIERLGASRLREFDADLLPTMELGNLADLEADWK